MIYFSSLLKSPRYRPFDERISAALDEESIPFSYIENTKDIWIRDFMPVRTKSGKYISFRYEPGYLENDENLRTDFRDIEDSVPVKAVFSDINLDGGNAVFSPLKEKVIISDRVLQENPDRQETELKAELEKLLEAEVIIIPSLKSDMTGHADGMVRFVDESTAICNQTPYKSGLEYGIKTELKKHCIDVEDFPYFDSPKISAVGSYLNYLETKKVIILPVFGHIMDNEAVSAANSMFQKKIVPVRCEEIAQAGGCLNCISWENE